LKTLSPAEVKSLMDEGIVLLDVRHQKQFAAGHVPNSYGIRVDAPLTTWAGWVIPFGSRIMLVSESADQRSDATRQLIRIGYDDLIGYLEGGVEAWAREYPVETVQTMSAPELRGRLGEVRVDGHPPLQLVDVRQRSEWNAGHIPDAVHFEGGRVAWEHPPFKRDQQVVIQCASGNRSMVAISVLQRRGFHNLIQLDGGINQWKKNGFEIVQDNPDSTTS
jgi:hydroxyacylglutathione hydrolase